MLTYRRAGAQEMPLDRLADSFREWFGNEPWLERFRCPNCNAFNDFGSQGRYAEINEEGRCPACGVKLLGYWTDERVIEYYFDSARHDGFHQVLGYDDQGEVQSWAWGYSLWEKPEFKDMPKGGIYGDHVGVATNYRGPDSFEIMKRSFDSIREVGWEYMVIRTHQEADYVKDFLTELGFQKLPTGSTEPDREYMIFDLG